MRSSAYKHQTFHIWTNSSLPISLMTLFLCLSFNFSWLVLQIETLCKYFLGFKWQIFILCSLHYLHACPGAACLLFSSPSLEGSDIVIPPAISFPRLHRLHHSNRDSHESCWMTLITSIVVDIFFTMHLNQIWISEIGMTNLNTTTWIVYIWCQINGI